MISGDSNPRRSRALAATTGSMSQRENGGGGIKAMPSGHCAAETPNRKSPPGPTWPAALQNLKPYIFRGTIFDTIFDAHLERIFIMGFTSTAPVYESRFTASVYPKYAERTSDVPPGLPTTQTPTHQRNRTKVLKNGTEVPFFNSYSERLSVNAHHYRGCFHDGVSI